MTTSLSASCRGPCPRQSARGIRYVADRIDWLRNLRPIDVPDWSSVLSSLDVISQRS
jgi:hypothetical protein